MLQCSVVCQLSGKLEGGNLDMVIEKIKVNVVGEELAAGSKCERGPRSNSRYKLIEQVLVQYLNKGQKIPEAKFLANEYGVSLPTVYYAAKKLSVAIGSKVVFSKNTKSMSHQVREYITECIRQNKPNFSMDFLVKQLGFDRNAVYRVTKKLKKLNVIFGVSPSKPNRTGLFRHGRFEVVRQEVIACKKQKKPVPPCSYFVEKYGLSRAGVYKACEGLNTGWRYAPGTKSKNQLLEEDLIEYKSSNREIPEAKFFANKFKLALNMVYSLAKKLNMVLAKPASHECSEKVRQEVEAFIKRGEPVPPSSYFQEKYKRCQQTINLACKDLNTGWLKRPRKLK